MRYIGILLTSLLLFGCTQTKSVYTPKRTYAECSSVKRCASAIRIAISDNWSRPESSRNHMKVLVELSLNDQFAITSAKVIESSGSKKYDESAIGAVNLASPFTELAGLEKSTFNSTFSEFRLLFDPNDLQE